MTETDPRTLWPDLGEWEAAGMVEPVFSARLPSGETVFVRPDDGSASLLQWLSGESILPVPRVLDALDGWLLLSALPGVPLHQPEWVLFPETVAAIIAEALVRLQKAGVCHGDLCLPNILGDPATGTLSGLVDWRYAERFDREIDVAATVWSAEYNGYDDEVALSILRKIGWPVISLDELIRLRRQWIALTTIAGDG